ncbi:sodium/iodide cotransporter [Teleopsis dalmanni]|uniref:sodium/iodide cotransporter n=1 Tax=Teleopsis dalmanni TaxID=139649 RepID=UPI0018CE5638|nr:sodium/iodide cotransporter [Teleopsis dalmanni]
MARELNTLGWDYLMFALFIALTVLTPLWKRLFGRKKQRSKADYVFATGSVSIFAIMISIARGALGVRTILGYPSELFYYGSGMWEIIYGTMSAYPIVCFVFVPVYFSLGITSVYQYIDLRFKSRLVRCLASATYIARQICSLAITVYTPTVALATVIGIPYWASIIGMSTICIFFTIMGGLKAAINADVIQTITIIIVTMVVIIKGIIASGGPKQVYELNRNNGRLSFLNFTGDMTVRVDTASAWFGQLFMSLSQFGCQQNFMQRYVSLKSLKEVKRAMMLNIPVIFIFFSLSWITGLVIYSTYVNCDPYAEGYIEKTDGILPFFVEDQLAIIPGFLGIFMACLFNGALCMMVSNLNSLATVCCEDFLTLLPHFKGLGDKQQLFIIKVVTCIFGIVIGGVAFGVGLLSGVIESSMLAFSATSGPLLGCFILAILVPVANWKGTSAGMVASCAFVLWIIGGSMTINKSSTDDLLPTSTEGCANFTFSQSIRKPNDDFHWLLMHTPIESDFSLAANFSQMEQTTTAFQEENPLKTFYSISYMYYSLIGTAITVFVGFIISYLTQSPDDAYDSNLLHPLVFKLSQRFSGKKPYYVKEVDSDLTSVTNGKGAKINHAFESQNEANLIIGATAATTATINGQKDKRPIEIVFTHGIVGDKSKSNTDSRIATADMQSANNSGTYRQFSDKDVV